jgi:hypothetical protein
MWEFAANNPGWFFLYLLIVVPACATVLILLMFIIGDGVVTVKREQPSPSKFGSRSNANKVLKPEGKTTKNAGTTRH